MERKNAKKTENTEKKIAETRKEWNKEWGLEKQTEGLDKVQGESGEKEE